MTEAKIKATTLNRLRDAGRISRHAILANEYVLGKSSIRADLAIMENGRFIGVEIKSELDTLKRLPSQLAAYGMFFDNTLLVVAQKHSAKLRPDYVAGVELWEIDSSDAITPVSAKENGAQKDLSFISLLTISERRKYSAFLTPSLADPPQARAAFMAAFSDRFRENSNEFWSRVGRRKICAEDLAILSRYREQRLNVARQREERKVRWLRWVEQIRAGSELGQI